MPSPSYDDRLIAMFDSYCKEVSRNYIKDLVRKNERRGKYVSHEVLDQDTNLYLRFCPSEKPDLYTVYDPVTKVAIQ